MKSLRMNRYLAAVSVAALLVVMAAGCTTDKKSLGSTAGAVLAGQ